MEAREKENNKNSVKEYFDMSEVLTYFFRKKDPNHRPNFNLRMMHGINKLSIIIFLIAFVIWLVKRLA